jgi:tRNA-splicing ligase RtcB (3'-phosphate/5'-hydroxy nucleic acid ligase)
VSDDRGFNVWQAPGGAIIKAWTRGVEFETEAMEQVQRMAMMPFIFPWIAVMPDVHRGIGATVGSVVPMRGAVIPSAVGVDIGCGMMAVKLPLTIEDLERLDLAQLRAAIEKVVPAGRTNDGQSGDRGAWHNVPGRHQDMWTQGFEEGYRKMCERHPVGTRTVMNHMGTLGTGNHFLEVCQDENGGVWVVIHSGSRGIGAKLGGYYIDLAKKDMARYFIKLADPDLAYFPEGTENFKDYLFAVEWAQRYARVNREFMMIHAIGAISSQVALDFVPTNALDLVAGFEAFVDCHHNYLARENHGGQNVLVTRKGAVRARMGDLGIIPGSMGARSYIVRGLGSPESLTSCSHGAGRRMSRTQAKKTFTLLQHQAATAGVECDKSEETLDETPGAYKDIDAVMEAQRDLVEVVHTLKAVLCIKGISQESGWRKKRSERKKP